MMKTYGKQPVVSILILAALILACKGSKELSSNVNSQPANANAANKNTNESNADGVIASGVGTEKEKPAPDRGNVQGRVFYNGQPVPSVDVKLCEKFNQYFGGCSGETFVSKTDANGEYLLKNVTPRTYEGLLVRVFTTPYYVFATSGYVQTAKYKIEPGKTFFAPDTNLFKHDLKLESPKAGAKLPPDNIEIKWGAYPDAAYYKFGIYPDSSSGAATDYDLIGKRVDGLSYALDKPLAAGSYSIKVEAFNSSDIKLAQSDETIKFTVTGSSGTK
jgi:hypothetical protein